MEIQIEIWKDIPWYEWKYKASNLWNIYSVYLWKNLSQCLSKWYRKVWIYKNWVQKRYPTHRLIALAFIENPENKPFINHKNWIKHDNNIDNLEWCTPSENCLHAIRTWLNIIKKWKESHMYWRRWELSPAYWRTGNLNANFWKKRNPKSWRRIRSIIWIHKKSWETVSFESIIYAEINLNIDDSSIVACCRNKRKSAWWYIWKYTN